MSFTVFYAWQSDRPQKTNRWFLRDALEQAIKAVNHEYELDEAPAVPPHRAKLDHDVKDVPGTAHIAETISQKIGQCGIFVADLTFVGKARHDPDGAVAPFKKKRLPNPNVLIELGQAAALVGWQRIILVMNTASGPAKFLPFDLRHRSFPIQYELEQRDDPEKKKKQRDLAKSLETRIRTIIQAGVLSDVPDAKLDIRGPIYSVMDSIRAPKPDGYFTLEIYCQGADIYDMAVWMEIDGAVPNDETAHLPRSEQVLKKGYLGAGKVSFESDEGEIPNPFKRGQHVKLRLAQSRLTEMLDMGCGGERLKEMDDGRFSVVIRSAGDRVVKRILGGAFREELRWT